MILYRACDLTYYARENAWVYFALLRRCVANDNGFPVAEEQWLRAAGRWP